MVGREKDSEWPTFESWQEELRTQSKALLGYSRDSYDNWEERYEKAQAAIARISIDFGGLWD